MAIEVPALQARDISKVFEDGFAALTGIDLSIREGEFVTLLGPSGCGKTTLLKVFAGFHAPSSGRIELGGKDITGAPPESRDMAMCFQSYALFPFGALPAPSHLAEWGISRVSASFALAFSLSAPFLIASLLYNVALGVINKAMPQLMVAFVGAPAITWGGVGLLMLVTPAILTSWSAAFDATLANPWAAP